MSINRLCVFALCLAATAVQGRGIGEPTGDDYAMADYVLRAAEAIEVVEEARRRQRAADARAAALRELEAEIDQRHRRALAIVRRKMGALPMPQSGTGYFLIHRPGEAPIVSGLDCCR